MRFHDFSKYVVCAACVMHDGGLFLQALVNVNSVPRGRENPNHNSRCCCCCCFPAHIGHRHRNAETQSTATNIIIVTTRRITWACPSAIANLRRVHCPDDHVSASLHNVMTVAVMISFSRRHVQCLHTHGIWLEAAGRQRPCILTEDGMTTSKDWWTKTGQVTECCVITDGYGEKARMIMLASYTWSP